MASQPNSVIPNYIPSVAQTPAVTTDGEYLYFNRAFQVQGEWRDIAVRIVNLPQKLGEELTVVSPQRFKSIVRQSEKVQAIYNTVLRAVMAATESRIDPDHLGSIYIKDGKSGQDFSLGAVSDQPSENLRNMNGNYRASDMRQMPILQEDRQALAKTGELTVHDAMRELYSLFFDSLNSSNGGDPDLQTEPARWRAPRLSLSDETQVPSLPPAAPDSTASTKDRNCGADSNTDSQTVLPNSVDPQVNGRKDSLDSNPSNPIEEPDALYELSDEFSDSDEDEPISSSNAASKRERAASPINSDGESSGSEVEELSDASSSSNSASSPASLASSDAELNSDDEGAEPIRFSNLPPSAPLKPIAHPTTAASKRERMAGNQTFSGGPGADGAGAPPSQSSTSLEFSIRRSKPQGLNSTDGMKPGIVVPILPDSRPAVKDMQYSRLLEIFDQFKPRLPDGSFLKGMSYRQLKDEYDTPIEPDHPLARAHRGVWLLLKNPRDLTRDALDLKEWLIQLYKHTYPILQKETGFEERHSKKLAASYIVWLTAPAQYLQKGESSEPLISNLISS